MKKVQPGMYLPKGTIIEVGERKGISDNSIGCHIKLKRGVNILDDGTVVDDAPVIKNPRGWFWKDMTHRITKHDYIVSIPSTSNKQASAVLDSEY